MNKRKYFYVFITLFLTLLVTQVFAEAGEESRGYLKQAKKFTAKKEYSKALDELDKFQRLEPGSPFGFGLRGYIFYKQKKYRKAIHEYNRAIDIKDDYVRAYIYRGRCYFLSDKLKEAEADYKKALELKPSEKEALFNLAELYRQSEKYQKAVEYYGKLLKVDPDNARAYNYRGMARRELKLYTEAASDHTKALHIRAGYVSAYINRGRALMQKGEDNLALRDFNTAIELAPKKGEIYYFRGLLLEKMDRIEEAKNDFRTFLDIDPQFYRKHRKEIKKKLARYENFDSKKSSIAVFIVFNERDPNQREIRNETKEVFEKLMSANRKFNKTSGESALGIPLKEYQYNVGRQKKILEGIKNFDQYKIPFVGIVEYRENKPSKFLKIANLKLHRFEQYEDFMKELKNYRHWIKVLHLDSTVDIITTPEKASVYMDRERLTPITPIYKFKLPAGEHRMIIRKNGYFEVEKKFFLKYGDHLVLDKIRLESKVKED